MIRTVIVIIFIHSLHLCFYVTSRKMKVANFVFIQFYFIRSVIFMRQVKYISHVGDKIDDPGLSSFLKEFKCQIPVPCKMSPLYVDKETYHCCTISYNGC